MSTAVEDGDSYSNSNSKSKNNNSLYWTVCSNCHGEGKIRKNLSKKTRIKYEMSNNSTSMPIRFHPCPNCQKRGIVLQPSNNNNATDSYLPSVAIVGGGIGGFALGIACWHRNIPCRIYERDQTFDDRSQGYGLTMQQASRILQSLGITTLDQGITSTKHVVHDSSGTVLGEWGMRKWKGNQQQQQQQHQSKDAQGKKNKRQNIHIARQALRQELWTEILNQEQKHNQQIIFWNHQLLNYYQQDGAKTTLTFQVEQQNIVDYAADIVVGADGIRSTVRQQLVSGGLSSPLIYLGCLVILGICDSNKLPTNCELLDGQTVFQTANGTTRIYAMPFSKTQYMWQLSFPMSELNAKEEAAKSKEELKQLAISVCHDWHDPIPQLLQNSCPTLISGYPVYDRDLLTVDMLPPSSNVTILGDAAHPMSPFKGQGANQALLDALSLARSIYRHCKQSTNNETISAAIQEYQQEMISRSASKVQASAAAADFLHSDIAIQQGNITRGAAAAMAVAENGSEHQAQDNYNNKNT